MVSLNVSRDQALRRRRVTRTTVAESTLGKTVMRHMSAGFAFRASLLILLISDLCLLKGRKHRYVCACWNAADKRGQDHFKDDPRVLFVSG